MKVKLKSSDDMVDKADADLLRQAESDNAAFEAAEHQGDGTIK